MRPREICSFVGIFENVRGISKVVENVRGIGERKRKGSKLEAQKEVGKRRLVCYGKEGLSSVHSPYVVFLGEEGREGNVRFVIVFVNYFEYIFSGYHTIVDCDGRDIRIASS